MWPLPVCGQRVASPIKEQQFDAGKATPGGRHWERLCGTASLESDMVTVSWSRSLRSAESECLFTVSRREVLQQFLRSLIEPLLVFLLFLAGLNRMLGSTYPNELLCGRIIHANNESPNVNG